MNTGDFRRINTQILDDIKESKPDVTQYDNEKDFSELYHSNVTFFQVFYYDRNDATTYGGNQKTMNVDGDIIEQLEQEIEQYHILLTDTQKKLVEEQIPCDYDKRAYFYNNRVSDDIGFAHFRVFERNQEREDREEQEREKHMKQEDEYSCSRCRDGGCPHCAPNVFI